MKIIALYLPQYHAFPENNEWWGEGYTEWKAVKQAKPLFKGHEEPRVPLNDRYYDLDIDGYETLKWQSELANKYGLYGFCFYQYWFCGHKLMEKPAEKLLQHKDINIRFCFSWANETWTRTWYSREDEILIEQTYGDKDNWIEHFNYLLPFFKDDRYIRVNGKPMFCIYRAQNISCLKEMLELWDVLAKQEGFPGVHIVAGNTAGGCDNRGIVDAYYNFEPGLTLAKGWSEIKRQTSRFGTKSKHFLNQLFKTNMLETKIDAEKLLGYINNERIMKNVDQKTYLGAFPQWDNTPRRSFKGIAYTNTNPAFFEEQLKRIDGIRNKGEFVFINAWNEWGEGCYLEPDMKNKYAFLEVIRKYSE